MATKSKPRDDEQQEGQRRELDPATLAIGTITANRAGQVAGNTGWHQGALKQAESPSTLLGVEMGADPGCGGRGVLRRGRGGHAGPGGSARR